MKKLFLTLGVLIVFLTANAKGENSQYQCEIATPSDDLVKASVSFYEDTFGGIAGARVDLIKVPSSLNSTVHFRGKVKTPKRGSYDKNIYLETHNNCTIWPICDLYFLRFVGFKHKIYFDELPPQTDFVFESVTGQATNRCSYLSKLTCTKE